jgi:hypothetical protein
MFTTQGAPVIHPVRPRSAPVKENCGVAADPAMGFSWKVLPLALNWALLSPAKFKVAWLLVAAQASPTATVVMLSMFFRFVFWLIFIGLCPGFLLVFVR